MGQTTGWVRSGAAIVTASESAPTAVSATRPTNMINCRGWRSFRCMCFVDSAAADSDIELYGVESQENTGAGIPGTANPVQAATPTFLTRLILSVANVLGGVVAGIASTPNLVGTTEFYCDAYDSPVIAAYGARLLANFDGSADSLSVAGGLGEILISNVGNCVGILPRVTVVAEDYFGFIYRLDS